MSIFRQDDQRIKKTESRIWKLPLGKLASIVNLSVSSINPHILLIEFFNFYSLPQIRGKNVKYMLECIQFNKTTYLKNLLDLQTNKKVTVNITISGQPGRLTILQTLKMLFTKQFLIHVKSKSNNHRIAKKM